MLSSQRCLYPSYTVLLSVVKTEGVTSCWIAGVIARSEGSMVLLWMSLDLFSAAEAKDAD